MLAGAECTGRGASVQSLRSPTRSWRHQKRHVASALMP